LNPFALWSDQWETKVMGIVMRTISLVRSAAALVVIAAATSFATSAFASPFFPFGQPPHAPAVQAPADEATDEGTELAPRFKRQIVDYRTGELPGTIVIDTPNTYLYLVLGNGKAMRYGIGVGREGFTWSGVQNITKKAEWPDWTPPAEMLERQPYLPRFMAGGPGNPLGARAMYLGGSVYRIHGTNDPSTIGHHVSSGCIRLTNDDVSDLYSRVNVGTKVVVLPMTEQRASAGTGAIY
jgi:lipoprotein-anchoring transpeptidase ErfK/SrfK